MSNMLILVDFHKQCRPRSSVAKGSVVYLIRVCFLCSLTIQTYSYNIDRKVHEPSHRKKAVIAYANSKESDE